MNESVPAARVLPELCSFGAVALAELIRRRDVSAVEVMRTHLDHIERVNPAVNAIISLRPRDELLAEARKADEALARGDTVSPLHGVPQAIKDLALTKGLRTTFGSHLFADFVPDQDAIIVERMRAAGALIIGKTNVPEYGYGSNSYNPIFGLTRNAYDQSRVGGGSSGGAAVALALRMLSVADGGDMGGSLRNPAAFNNVFGFRPSQGLVPAETLDPFYGQMAVEGPMGRSIDDVAMLLSVQAGSDPRAPLSYDDPRLTQWRSLRQTLAGVRFGWLGDLGGHLPFEPGVLELCQEASRLLEAAGGQVEPATIAFDPERLWQAWVTLRSHSISGRHQNDYGNPETRRLLNPQTIWEIENGQSRSGLAVYEAGLARGAWHKALLRAFERFDFLLLPSAQVFPFEAETRWPTEIAGRRMDSYHRWMEVVIGPTFAGAPAVSVPAGFNEAGLPMGLQIIAAPRRDADLLAVASLYEKLCPWLSRLPALLS
ncbi:amidase [Bosea sp. UC22_33]|uniref:amidase n=1 Tax=Bosea sp. UC22_33 TaxID=3350165 RepID=UPI00366F6420